MVQCVHLLSRKWTYQNAEQLAKLLLKSYSPELLMLKNQTAL